MEQILATDAQRLRNVARWNDRQAVKYTRGLHGTPKDPRAAQRCRDAAAKLWKQAEGA